VEGTLSARIIGKSDCFLFGIYGNVNFTSRGTFTFARPISVATSQSTSRWTSEMQRQLEVFIQTIQQPLEIWPHSQIQENIGLGEGFVKMQKSDKQMPED
jgi:hypothetical protein